MIATITDLVEAGAIALAQHKGLRWESIKESWREEQRQQVRAVLAAAKQARQGGYRFDRDELDLLNRSEGGQP